MSKNLSRKIQVCTRSNVPPVWDAILSADASRRYHARPAFNGGHMPIKPTQPLPTPWWISHPEDPNDDDFTIEHERAAGEDFSDREPEEPEISDGPWGG